MVKPLKCPFQQKFEKSRGYFSLDKNEWHDSLSFDHLLDFKIFKRLSFGMFWHCGRKCDTLSKKLKIRFCGGGGSGQEGEHFFRFSFRSLKKKGLVWWDTIKFFSSLFKRFINLKSQQRNVFDKNYSKISLFCNYARWNHHTKVSNPKLR